MILFQSYYIGSLKFFNVDYPIELYLQLYVVNTTMYLCIDFTSTDGQRYNIIVYYTLYNDIC